MNWFWNRSLFPLMAMLLATAAIVLAGDRAAASVSSVPMNTAHLSSVLGHGDAGPAVASMHGNPGVDQGHATRTADPMPCDVACLGSSSGCVAPPLISRTGGLVHRRAETVCLRPGDDLMLAGVVPDARLKPPKPIA